MRQIVAKCAAAGFLVLVALWIVGIAREAAQPYPQPALWHLASGANFDELASSNRNLQVANNIKQLGLATTPLPLVLEQPDLDKLQVYEKTGHLALGTEAFDAEENAIRGALAAHQAIAFDENRGGIEPGRRLVLQISVPPDQFDALFAELQRLGQVRHVSDQKRDRTGEFRRLHAQRQSLKQYLASVLKLRDAKPLSSIEDQLKLEQKIQDIEKELQALGVQMGDFLGKESYYQITLSLTEYLPGGRLDPTYAAPQRLAHALVWALGWWAALAVAATVLAATYLSMCILWPRRGNARG
jgi:hypothetical protein